VSVGREGLARLLNLIFQGICIDDLVKNTQKDGFVKSSPATGGTRRAKTEE
jgi:hypothetical protein